MKQLRAIVIAVVAVVLVSAVVIGNNWTARIPADAAATALARTALDPDMTSDTTATGEVQATSMVNGVCLDRIQRPSGALDLCWAVFRVPDADPLKDYFELRVHGTAFGALGSGIRWAVVRAHLVGQPKDGVFDTWPRGQYDGPCMDEVVTTMGVMDGTGIPTDTVCGRAIGSSDDHDWSQRLEWYCVGCLLPGKRAVGIALHQVVGVAQGTVPAWDIYGDLGD